MVAQAPNRYKDQVRGIVKAALIACAADEPPDENSTKGTTAIASKAENQTANRVPELRRPIIRSNSQANNAITVPWARQLASLSMESCATKCISRAFILLYRF